MASGTDPVLVGVAAVQQREADPERALEPAALMAEALRRAAADAGARDLLSGADRIYVPRGFTPYPDPGRLVADRVGATRARSVLVEIGVLQTSLFGHAARAIARGEAEVVLLAGGEAKYRQVQAAKAGREAEITRQGEVTPDEVLRPAAEIMHPLEIGTGLVMAVRQYAVMESALRHADKEPVDAHRRRVAELWERFNRVARTNPLAWSPEPVSAEEIEQASASNRMLAFPYTRLHNSQWNVDQAAGLLLCSRDRALRAGIPEERFVYPLAVAESNHMVPLVRRRDLHRSPGFALAGARAFADAGLELDQITHRELYSCFPVAVRIQARELGISEELPLTVTGGMAFAGGPLNNFVLQAAVRMAELLRAEGGHGLLDAISGFITKQGVSLWSSTPPADGRSFRYEDVSREAERETPLVPVAEAGQGPGRVAGYTLIHETGGAEPDRAAAYVDLDDGSRTIAVTTDRDWMQQMMREELCGERVRVAGGALHPD